jgi:hypothetical protein
MFVLPDRPALRLLSVPAVCMTASLCVCMAQGIVPPCVTVEVLVPQARVVCHGLCTSRSQGELVRDKDLSCEAETSRARRRLVRGGDSSGGSHLWGTGRSCCQLVRDATNRSGA